MQWKWPNIYGEDRYVIMLGGLHIEMAVWNTLGDFLEDSGWTIALTQAGIASSGTADSFLKAAHLTEQDMVIKFVHWLCRSMMKKT